MGVSFQLPHFSSFPNASFVACPTHRQQGSLVKEMFLFVCFLLKKIYFIVIEEILSYIWSKWTVPPDRRTGKVEQAQTLGKSQN